MISIKNIYTIIFATLLILCPVGVAPITGYIDELTCGIFICLAIIDSIINHRWRQYSLLWILISIMACYTAYTLVFHKFNITSMVLMDAFIEVKPFVSFAAGLGCGLIVTQLNHSLFKFICIISATAISIVTLMGYSTQTAVTGHPAFAGMSLYITVMVYLLVSLDKNSNWTHRTIALSVIWLICGLMCARSKYYGEFVLTLFFLFIYRPGMLKGFKPKHFAIIITFIAVFIIVIWQKFSYYFITGNSDVFDPNEAASFARPALYLTGALIIYDYFPFGSGLASFATYASDANYSTLYYEYNLDKVYGLMPDYSAFICDAYYPSLAQFGAVGIILFIIFWRWIYVNIRRFIRIDPHHYSNYFRISSLLICFLLIECTTGTGFTTPTGFLTMFILGMLCRQAKELSHLNSNIDSPKLSNIYLKTSKRIKI